MTYVQGYLIAEQRFDALQCKKGKPCGKRCIPKEQNCSSGGKSPSALAVGAGALGAGVLLSQGTKQVNRQIDRKFQQPINEAVDKAVDKAQEKVVNAYKKVSNKLKKKKSTES